jgi:hypothetical protein
MPCDPAPTLYSGLPGDTDAFAPSADFESRSSRHLFLSDDPETITAMPMAAGENITTNTLYAAPIELGAGTHSFRVFLWHVNSTGSTIYLHLVMSLSAGSGTVGEWHEQTEHTQNYAAAGRCLAWTQLYDEWPAEVTGKPQLSTTEQRYWSSAIEHGKLRAVVAEFEVTLAQAAELRIRSLVSGGATTIAGNWGDPLVPRSEVHPRGCWPFADLTLDGGEFQVNPIPNTENRHPIAICQRSNNPTDHTDDSDPGVECGPDGFREDNAVNPEVSWRNRAAYGANLFYKFKLKNSASVPMPAWVWIQTRNIDGAYLAAARVQGKGKRCIQAISPSGPQGVNLTEDTANDPLMVPARIDNEDGELDIVVEVSNGGAGTTPANLVVARYGLQTEDPPGDSR